MALTLIENLQLQARNASQEDIDKLCAGILDILGIQERLGECIGYLRQLFFILQTSPVEPYMSTETVSGIVNRILPGCKGLRVRLCLICRQIVAELLPEESLPKPNSENVKASFLSLDLIQGEKLGCLAEKIPQAMKWILQENDFETQQKSFSFLISVAMLHSRLLTADCMKKTSDQMAGWLMNASLYQAQNPYTMSLFKKEQTNMVNEVDGTPSRNFFTVLNIGQYYTDDQLMNIGCFSLLYKWLHYAHTAMMAPVDGETDPRETKQKVAKAERVFGILVNRTVDYCLRLLDQCERKAKVQSDAELQCCCLMEAVTVLDIVCKIDDSQVPKIFQEIRRLFSRLSQDTANTRILLNILQFFINHSDTVVHDPQEAYNLYFHKLLTRSYNDPALAFDTVMFLRNNIIVLCQKTNILTVYFPNILKILAWNPRTYVQEFCDIIPAIMSPTTSMEVFHALLDLPCMTASLEVMEKSRKDDVSTPVSITSDEEPSSSVEAFYNTYYRPMFNFFSRVEGGHGDTINKLSSFHKILGDMKQHPRVLVCCQAVPVLLRLWFSVVHEEAGSDFVSHLFPAMLERSGLLFGIPEYQADVKKIMSEYVLLLFKSFPELVTKLKIDLMDFLISIRNITGREEFFANLVWAVGEFSSTTFHSDCGADTIGRFFDVLEALTYEVSSVMFLSETGRMPFSVKVISVLMSAIGKLASRCQDLIPRAILCLTKVAKQPQQQANSLDVDDQEALVTRAQELINLLKLPNFSSVVLNPSPEIETGRWHRESTSLPVVLRGTHHILCQDS